MFLTLRSQFHAHYTRVHRLIPIIAFVCGFLFDMAILKRIDEPKVMIQQAIYLLIACALMTIDLMEFKAEINPEIKVEEEPPVGLKKLWKYREFFLHFFLGTLLNSYTIFYFKSASGITSFVFIFLLVAVLTISEFRRFGKSQHQVHMGLWSLCLISYFQSLIPILIGSIGVLVFLASGLVSILVFSFYYKIILRKFNLEADSLKKQVLYPYIMMHALFTLLYFSHAIPPVPLSVSYMGIYHKADKSEDQYALSYTRSWQKFWQHGDETFRARAGDTIIAFIQVFSPAKFKENLQVKWSFYDPKLGWQAHDTIPLTVTGGREEGYRAVVRKSNYEPGKWRVQIETSRNDEIGRIGFTVVTDESTEERIFYTDLK